MRRRGPITLMLLATALAVGACRQHEQAGQGDSPEEADAAVPAGAIPAAPDQTPGLEGTNAPGAVQQDTLPPPGGGATGGAPQDSAQR